MARYAYKDVVYRADFQALCEGFEAKYGRELDPDPNYDGDYWGVAADLLDAKDAEIEALRGQVAEIKGCVPAMVEPLHAGEPLPRFGIRWNGPTEPLCVPMDDGYWTPWHYAEAKLADCQAVIRDRGHDADCPVTQCCKVCGMPKLWTAHRPMFDDYPEHHEFQAGPCSDACGHDRTTGEKA